MNPKIIFPLIQESKDETLDLNSIKKLIIYTGIRFGFSTFQSIFCMVFSFVSVMTNVASTRITLISLQTYHTWITSPQKVQYCISKLFYRGCSSGEAFKVSANKLIVTLLRLFHIEYQETNHYLPQSARQNGGKDIGRYDWC